MRKFQDAISFCDLTDLSYVGPFFTWTNNQVDNPIGKNLDRDIVNSKWLATYPNSFTTFEMGGISDHAQFWL